MAQAEDGSSSGSVQKIETGDTRSIRYQKYKCKGQYSIQKISQKSESQDSREGKSPDKKK
jgi:hypothetical protein